MLLCVDIGNTNIVIGLYRGEHLVAHWRISTVHERTADEYAIIVLNLFQHGGFGMDEVSDCIIASVVPPLTERFQELVVNYLEKDPLVVGTGTRTGVAIRYDRPQEVGADRIINVAAAFREYGGPACIVDFGTGTTFDALSATGEYLGGAIAPGIRIAAEALFQRTAKLPRIDLQRPPKAIGTNTVDAMRSGILFGYVGLVEGLVARFRAELGPHMHVIATGGLGEVIARETSVIEHVDPWLTLRGLRLVYDLNRGAG
ncbi:MAG: type III pantothenate kinase [Anaerolineae bacterium]|jgi:type III pantothenate kinase|nr:type III pantothenate kinase [Chloroflexota bacterium]